MTRPDQIQIRAVRPIRPHRPWDAQDFVRRWQTAGSVAEVAEALGRSRGHCYRYAHALRAQGVPLRRFSRRGEVDLLALVRLARQLALARAESPETRGQP